jgi:hypothetical protein
MTEAFYIGGSDYATTVLGLEKVAVSLGFLERAALRAEQLASQARTPALELGGIRKAIRKGAPKPANWGKPMSPEAFEASGAYEKARDRANTLRIMFEGRKQGIPVQLSEARGATLQSRFPTDPSKATINEVTLGVRGGPPRAGREAQSYEDYLKQHKQIWSRPRPKKKAQSKLVKPDVPRKKAIVHSKL